jgi:two-component system, LytTR family, response regulator
VKLTCIIIEDEPLALEKTRSFVTRLPDLNLVACFENSADAIAFLSENRPDLLFLDISMDGLSGIQLLENISFTGQVIITTAYDEFALKGYDLNVTDYLLKPFTFERFLRAVSKAQKNIEDKTKAGKNFIFVKTEYRLEKLFLNDILYIEGMRDYRRIHTDDKRIMTLQTFRDFEHEIPKNIICRIHKSYMVSLDKIAFVERDRVKIKDVLLPVSETYKKEFMELINR